MIWVALVDDHASVRDALRRYIEQEPDMKCAADFPDAESMLLFLQTGHADVLVTDLRMPGMGGLLAIPKVRQVAPHVRVVVFSAQPAVPYAQMALNAGASSYLEKPGGLGALVSAIRQAVTNGP